MILLPQKVAYRGTLTGLRISSVDGTAFLDNCAALIPYADGNHRIEIYDASNRMLQGYLKAQGSSEVVSETETITNGTFAAWTGDNPDNWNVTGEGGGNEISEVGSGEAHGGTGTGACNFYTTGAGLYIWQDTLITGALFKATLNLSSVVSGGLKLVNNIAGAYNIVATSTGATSGYFTSINTNIQVYRNTGVATDVTLDSFSAKKVTAPSSDGVTIVSTKGGATQSFATVQAGFAYNAAAYSVVVRKAR